MASGDQVLGQLKSMVTGLSVKQRALLVGAALVTAATVALFVNWIGKPDLKPLYTNMEPADAQSLATRLASKQIEAQLSTDGKTVNVPADKLDAARLEMASQGMPHSGRLGFELFDKMNWGETEFDEKVNYQRALEGELERTIQTLNGVESARVHLVMSADSLFVDRQREAKASVILNMKSGQITPELQMSLARLVSGAVDNLRPENVTIVDANSNMPSSMPKHDPLSPEGDMEKVLTARVMDTLIPVVGPERVRASVNVQYDSASSEENSETYDPKSAVAVSTQKSDEQVGAAGNGGVPGTSSNVPAANGDTKDTTTAESDDSSQVTHSEANSYVVSKVVKHTLQPAGRVQRISAALVVDDAVEVKEVNGKRTQNRHKRTPDELKQIEELAKAAIGFDAARGDVVAVQNISFREAEEAAAMGKPSIVEKARVILTSWSSLIRYAVLLLLPLRILARFAAGKKASSDNI